MTMALLKSVDNVPGVDFYEYRDKEFYGKYNFRLRVDVPGVRYTWYCRKPEDLDRKLKEVKKGYQSIKPDDVQTVKDNLPALKAILQLQNDRKKTKSLGLRVEGTKVAIFSNDLQELAKLKDVIGTSYTYDMTEAQTSEYAGVKLFVKEPPHKYRVYLKGKRVAETFMGDLRDLIARTPSLYPSNALQLWMKRERNNWRFHWSSASHYIDYDDESTLSYLALIHGDMLGKKYKLEKRPDPV